MEIIADSILTCLKRHVVWAKVPMRTAAGYEAFRAIFIAQTKALYYIGKHPGQAWMRFR